MRVLGIGLFLSLAFVVGSCGSSEVVKEEVVVSGEDAKPAAEAETVISIPKKPDMGVWQWSYAGNKGPENWSKLNEEYKTCDAGSQQSPINLRWRKPAGQNPLKFQYTETEAVVTNTGYTYRIEFSPGSKLIFDGKEYVLEKAEFRTPSEHRLSGKSLPMEMQFYHRSPDGAKQAVISLFVVNGKGSTWFDQFWDMAKVTPLHKSSAKFKFDPNRLIPPRHTHYRYTGSLTHPPCKEGVAWFVFNTPLQLSREQVAVFRTVYENNNRPLQKENKRMVTNY